MLKPKAISQVLKQATTGGVKAALILNSEGSPLVFVSETGDRDARVYAAIASNVWSTFEKNTRPLLVTSGGGGKDDAGSSGGLKFLLVECEEGNLAITTVANMLLCLVAKPDVALGILKAKTDALARHLEEPFQQVISETLEMKQPFRFTLANFKFFVHSPIFQDRLKLKFNHATQKKCWKSSVSLGITGDQGNKPKGVNPIVEKDNSELKKPDSFSPYTEVFDIFNKRISKEQKNENIPGNQGRRGVKSSLSTQPTGPMAPDFFMPTLQRNASKLAAFEAISSSNASKSRDSYSGISKSERDTRSDVTRLIKDMLAQTGEKHIFNVHSSSNNTIVALTRSNGQILIRQSGGNVGFKKAQRGGYEAAHQAAISVIKKAQDKNIKIQEVEIVLKGFGPGREAAFKAIIMPENAFNVKRVTDATPIPHNGCRPKKARRI
ncbi:hypothetical protein G9A89_012163 [Geosiphon pyriformis]|nr:hypothetical protein G9A89_012163 [Geosiphon pyriformis]